MYENYKVNVPNGKSGNWEISQFEYSKNVQGYLYNVSHNIYIPDGIYTRLTYNGNIVMSDTPSEISDHLKFIFKCKEYGGRILINGLGLGMVLKAILKFSNIEQIDIVEKSEDVIKLVAPTYILDPRVKIYNEDAFIIKWPKNTKWNCIWHDIWSDICVDNLEEMKKLHRKYGKSTIFWQGSWSKEKIQYFKRQGRY